MGSFSRATKKNAKLRLALCGPAGSGKTYSLLSIASELGGPIAYVDTEHGSASKYADVFQFDVIEPTSFDPRDLINLVGEAVQAGYRVICIDSLSHYWMGQGGELELVDTVASRSKSGNSFAAWKSVTPIHNKLVDTFIGAPIHVLVSMRTKTEWVIEKDERTGKNAPRKIGLAPVMRDGIEFEFDLCGDMDQDNNLVVTKSRCSALAGQVINRPGKAMAQELKRWLSDGTEPASATPEAVTPAAAVPSKPTTEPAAATAPVPDDPLAKTLAGFASKANIRAAFQEMKNHFRKYESEEVWNQILEESGINLDTDTYPSVGAARKCFTGVWKATARLQAEANAAMVDDTPMEIEADRK